MATAFLLKLLSALLLLGFLAAVSSAAAKYDTATFAGGCFWCMQPPFEKLDGVIQVLSGYSGGKGKDPTYDDYAEKSFVEAIQITYDPAKISYTQLLDTFWRQVNPTDSGGQFVDRGPQYATAIYYHSDEQKALAEKSKTELGQSGRYDKPIVTPIIAFTNFYKAEDYHQGFCKKNPARYKNYRSNAGRDQYLEKVWTAKTPEPAGNAAVAPEKTPAETKSPGWNPDTFKKPSAAELKKMLTPLQYKVTQESGTELSCHNGYWDNHRDGIYVDIVSGEPLYSSLDKYESGSGWPSFTKPLEPGNIVEKTDKSFSSTRTEVRSKHAGSHLGHVFDDGPKPAGLRYCINSAALRFIPKEDLVKEGYGQYTKLFEK